MNRRRAISRLAAMAAGEAFLCLAGTAVAQVAATRHNLGALNGVADANTFSGTGEVCVFCHTPHGGESTALVPLWNRALPAPASFTTYDSLGTSTLEGHTAPVGSVSIACLSCHDGVTSMSALINAPGSSTAGDAAWRSGAWSGARQHAGILASDVVTRIGRDLRDDHPIGVQYGGGGLTARTPAGATRDPDFRAPAWAMLNGVVVWWVDSETAPNGMRQKTDLVLYARAPDGGYREQTDVEPFVECASCHDPHTSRPTFLRIANEQSKLCLVCHQK